MAIDRRRFNEWQDEDGTGKGTRLSKKILARDILDPIDMALDAIVRERVSIRHGDTHSTSGTDPVMIAASQVTGLDKLLAKKVDTSDPRLARGEAPDLTKLTARVDTLDHRVAVLVELDKSQVETTDPRLSNARTPLQHAATHGAKSSDPILISSLGGFPGVASAFLNGNGAWVDMPTASEMKTTEWEPTLNGVKGRGVYCRIGPLVFFQAGAQVPPGEWKEPPTLDPLPVKISGSQYVPFQSQWADGWVVVTGFYFAE